MLEENGENHLDALKCTSVCSFADSSWDYVFQGNNDIMRMIGLSTKNIVPLNKTHAICSY